MKSSGKSFWAVADKSVFTDQVSNIETQLLQGMKWNSIIHRFHGNRWTQI